MQIYLENNVDFSTFSRFLTKLNDSNLQYLSLNQSIMSVKDLIKLIHYLNSLQKLILTFCEIHGDIENVKITTKSRLELKSILLNECSYGFEIEDLARFLLQNDSLKKQLSIRSYSQAGKSENILCSDL